ncbi:MAG: hypothetical protein ABIB41_01910 [Nitrospirota bacterium]
MEDELKQLDNKQTTNQEENSIEKAINVVKETKGELSIANSEAKKAYMNLAKVCYEYDRLEQALNGTIQNLAPISGYTQSLEGTVIPIIDTSKELSVYLKDQRQEFKKISEIFTDTSSIPASGSSILANSTNLYSANIEVFNLYPVPPSIEKNVNPYVTDQEEVEDELKKLLQEIDPSLSELYSESKEIFKTPHRNRLDYAATEMRKLIWEILRKLAPHDKVSASCGFIQDPNKEQGVPTYRQQIAFILTGGAELRSAKANLIKSVFEAIDDALSVFSGKIKTIKGAPDQQIRLTMDACERAILTLLKNMKV